MVNEAFPTAFRRPPERQDTLVRGNVINFVEEAGVA